jgi:hypothetical protein
MAPENRKIPKTCSFHQASETPFYYHSLTSLSSHFPLDIIQKWQDVVLASVKPDTRGNYGAGLLHFNHFCDTHGIPEDQRMPANKALLSLFIASVGAGHVASEDSHN